MHHHAMQAVATWRQLIGTSKIRSAISQCCRDLSNQEGFAGQCSQILVSTGTWVSPGGVRRALVEN